MSPTIEHPVGLFYNLDAIEFAIKMPDAYFDLTLTSPPYEDARVHSGNLVDEDWVDWATTLFMELYRCTKGVTIFVVEGRTRDFTYSCTPFKLVADLARAGVRMRKPAVYHRKGGIPGGGGSEWLRNDWELVICATHGKLSWADQSAIGHPPVCPAGGPPSHRKRDGSRVKNANFKQPAFANHGNVFTGNVGKNHMGSNFAHENTAPFPEWLVDPFIRSMCPPDGIVLDPMGGSGTTVAVAEKLGRRWCYNDNDEAQCRIAARRIHEVRESSP